MDIEKMEQLVKMAVGIVLGIIIGFVVGMFTNLTWAIVVGIVMSIILVNLFLGYAAIHTRQVYTPEGPADPNRP